MFETIQTLANLLASYKPNEYRIILVIGLFSVLFALTKVQRMTEQSNECASGDF